ncbi:MAG: AI-2E family transporter [Pyrinomonadaceae bacterium]
MARTRASWLALLVVMAAALYLNWLMLAPFVGVLAWAVVLVVVFYPLHRRIVARTGSPSWGAVLSTLIVIIAILLPLALIALAVVHEAGKFGDQLRDGGGLQGLLDPDSPATGRLVRFVERFVSLEELRSPEALSGRLRGLASQIAGRTAGLVGGVLGAIVQLFFIVFTMYYLFRDGESIRDALRDLLPLEAEQADRIFARTREVIEASIYGVLIIAAVQGVLGGLAFRALGLPSALLWGVVMIFLSLIPVAGAFVVWVPAALYLALTGAYVKAGLLTAWGVVVIGSADNLLRPRLVGQKTSLHELLIFFSVLGGLQVFGVLGLVLGPVIVAVTLALLDIFRHADRPAAEAGAEPAAFERQDESRGAG